jgi:hypothetical protein
MVSKVTRIGRLIRMLCSIRPFRKSNVNWLRSVSGCHEETAYCHEETAYCHEETAYCHEETAYCHTLVEKLAILWGLQSRQ